MTRGALVGLAAMVVMDWLNRRPDTWWERRPRPVPAPPVRWVLRRGPGQELERRDQP